MKIPELIEAEQKFSAAKLALESMYAEEKEIQDKLTLIQLQIKRFISPYEAAVAAAWRKQGRTLTGWVSSGGELRFTRYFLQAEKPTDRCWDQCAWLRIVYGERPLWTLDIRSPGDFTQTVLDPRAADPRLPEPEAEDMLAAADDILSRRFFLTDVIPIQYK